MFDTQFVVCRDYQAVSPFLDWLRREQHSDARNQGIPTKLCETHQQWSLMRPWGEPAHVGEVQILGNQEPLS